MKAISPISIFGPIVQYSIFKRCDCWIEVHENFQKRSFRHRSVILTANGKHILSVPLKRGKTKLKIKEVKISYDEDWQRNHLRTIVSAYAGAPYYDHYMTDIVNLFKIRHNYIFDFFIDVYQFFMVKLELNELKFTKQYNSENLETLDIRSTPFNFDFTIPKYIQVFEHKFGFVENLSILDLLFNLGPESSAYLDQILIKNKLI